MGISTSFETHGIAFGDSAAPEGSFSATGILVRVLNGENGGGGGWGNGGKLQTAFQALPLQQQEQIRNRWGSHFNEILSLSRETDAELFHEALFHLGQRLEREGHVEQAGLVYSAIAPGAGTAPLQIIQQSQERLEVLQGGGSMGQQMEHMGRGFARQALDPGLLLGATGMGLFGKGIELVGMRYLAGANFFRSATGIARAALEFAPRATGFGLEATAFPFAINGANELLGRSVSWAQMDHRILGSWFFLGGMRVGGGFGRFAERSLGVPGLQVAGSIAGVGLGHGGEVLAGLREWHGFSNFAVETFGTWANLQVAGRFSEYVFDGQISRMQRVMDLSTESIRREGEYGEGERGKFREWVDSISEAFNNFGGPKPLAATAGSGAIPSPSLRLSVSPLRSPNPLEDGRSYMTALSEASGGSSDRPPALPAMGVVRDKNSLALPADVSRVEATDYLKRILPHGRILPVDLEKPGFVEGLLPSFGVTTHPLDQQMFREGFAIAQRHTERVQETAFDIDEVYLHWSLSTRDLFRGLFEKGAEALYHQTAPDLLRYEPLPVAEGVELNGWQRIWFHGIQGLLQGRMGQNIQFHPGVRAFQLGLRLGQDKNLIMLTTGPAGRILHLANEDPATRAIYFGKLPNEGVTIEEVWRSDNIYTRDQLVQAMRVITDGEIQYPNDPMVRDYIRRIQENPGKETKLKHPAIAQLLAKRFFRFLVDDSETTFQILADLPNLVILQPPSARSKPFLNFTFGSTDRYLSRMSNGYVSELAEILGQEAMPISQRLTKRPTPADYPHQRLTIEIPWQKFAAGYVAPARELSMRGDQIRSIELAPPSSYISRRPLQMSSKELTQMTQRLRQEMELVVAGTGTRVGVEYLLGTELLGMSKRAPIEFVSYLDQYLTSQEQTRIPEVQKPLEERSLIYFSRVASLVAAKRAALKLLGMEKPEYYPQLEFRFGMPRATGEVEQALGGRRLHTSMTRDGEVGVGMAMVETAIWESGLVSFGLDLTTDRGQQIRRLQITPEHHTLAEAAYKATLRTHPSRQFNHYRYGEIQRQATGDYVLSGKTETAARELRGDSGAPSPLKIHALSFRVGSAVVGWVGIPALRLVGGAGGGFFNRGEWGVGSGERGEGEVEKSAATNRVLSPAVIWSAEDLRAEIQRIVEAIPSSPSYLEPHDAVEPRSGNPIQAVLQGRLQYGRLEALQELLSVALGKYPQEITVVENGPGTNLHLAQVLAKMGYHVVVKEAHPKWLEYHRRKADQYFTPEIRQRISYVSAEAIDQPTPADIVYWANPSLLSLEKPLNMSYQDYFGRDVKPGGFLVLQIDKIVGFEAYEKLPWDLMQWEIIFNESLPFLGRDNPNNVLPTSQPLNHHLQVLRRRSLPEPVLSSKETLVGEAESPYQVSPEGTYDLALPQSTVTVLGDLGGVRTLPLGLKGHRVIHIDRDPFYLRVSRRHVENNLSVPARAVKGNVEFLEKDWYDSRVEGNVVEAFFPLSGADVSQHDYPLRKQQIRAFMDRALHTKLGPKGGWVFILSEQPLLINDFSIAVVMDPTLKLVEEMYQATQVPIVGGYAYDREAFNQNYSWIIYQKKASP